MHVAAILKVKGRNVVTTSADKSLLDVAKLLEQNDIGCIVIEGDDGQVAGIVSERDLVRAMVDHGLGLLEMAVGDLMTRDVRTCGPEDDIEDVMDTMTNGRFRHMPVLVDGRLAGVVSIGDLVKHRMRELVDETKALREYVTDYR